jgi:hypothetical protein
MTLVRIISGGQTGVDQAALRAAQRVGLACGGWCPPGRVCETGVIPAEFPLRETDQDRSPAAPDVPRSQRTEWNVRDSDATLILRPKDGPALATPLLDPGTDWAWRCAIAYGKPLMICDPFDRDSHVPVAAWLRQHPIATLNVAGPSEGFVPGIGAAAYAWLVSLLTALRAADGKA